MFFALIDQHGLVHYKVLKDVRVSVCMKKIVPMKFNEGFKN